jgi:glycosyltransferase involved in cell wall biosynthesis
MSTEASRPRDQGDRFRDEKRWREAAEHYREHLKTHADDWPIMVQLGHCMKEAGDSATGLALYRQAEVLAPLDPDIKVQIGHALRLLGRPSEATRSYALALKLDPGCEAAERELVEVWARTGLPPPGADAAVMEEAPPPLAELVEDITITDSEEPAPLLGTTILPSWSGPAPILARRALAVPRVLFDISDLVQHVEQARRITGLQRVQLEISRAAIGAADFADVAIVAYLPETRGWHAITPTLFQRLVAYLEEDVAREAESRQAHDIRDSLLAGLPVEFRPGTTLVLLGACWSLPGYQRALMQARGSHGLRSVPFVHDCIPLLLPQHCDPGTVRDYARWFSSVAFTADAFLTNSQSTRDDLVRLQGRLLGTLAQRIEVVPLDAIGTAPSAPAAEEPPGALSIEGRKIPGPFVLCVASLEPRKDHGFILDAWRAIALARGKQALPLLVLVGRRGWGETGLEEQLHCPALKGLVVVLHDVSEADLARLYAGCLFTICNSQHEGWGLPVTESIAHGRVPVVPAHSGLLESGSGCAAFFPPGAFGPFRDILTRLIFDPAHRSALEQLLLTNRRLRSWREVARQIIDVVEDIGTAGGNQPRAFLRAGPVLSLQRRDLLRAGLAAAVIDTGCTGTGWGEPDDQGVPLLGTGAVLSLPLAVSLEEASRPCRIMLALWGTLDQRELQTALRLPGGDADAVAVRVKLRAGTLSVASFEITLPAGFHQLEITLAPGGEPEAPNLILGHLAGLAIVNDARPLNARRFREQLAQLHQGLDRESLA